MNDCQNKNYKILSYQSVAKQMNNRVYTHYYYKLMLIAWDIIAITALVIMGLKIYNSFKEAKENSL